MADDFISKRKQEVESEKIVMYIKGSKEQPMCGFSAKAIEIFNKIGRPFKTIDILKNPEIRAHMEEFSQWPTFPQIFIGGEFIGGSDIISEMNQNGELEPLVKKAFEK